MKKIILLIAVITISYSYNAQDEKSNYIKNSDFELVDKKPLKKLGFIDELCQEWTSGTKYPADIFASGVKSDKVGVPSNMFGTQSAYSGDCYAGFRAYTKDKKMSRSYVTIKLKKALIPNQQYCAKFNVSLADLSKYAVNNLGIYLSSKKVYQGNTADIIQKPQVLQKNNKVISILDGWETICGTFVATGKEKYLVIGNFERDDKIKKEKVKRPKGITAPQNYHAYYYLDDVSLVEITAKSQCACTLEDETVPDVLYSYSIRKTEETTIEEEINQYRVYYGSIKYNVNAIGTRDLNNLIVLLNDNPSININVVGHCVPEEVNEGKVNPRFAELGMKRANLVAQYLTEKGINASRISINSLEDTSPANTRTTPLSLAQNRRVEISVQ